jgi:hypothetical protein
VTPDQDGCCQSAATRVRALVKASIDNTNRSEALLQNICKLKASDLFPSGELGQAPAEGWLLIVSQTGHIAFVRPTPDFVKYSRRSRPNAHHFAQCERLGGQKTIRRHPLLLRQSVSLERTRFCGGSGMAIDPNEESTTPRRIVWCLVAIGFLLHASC